MGAPWREVLQRGPIVICTWGCIVNLKKIMAAAAVAFAFTAVGFGAEAVASAVPNSPVTPGISLPQDDGGWWWGPGHGHGHGHWGLGWGPGWGGPGWYGGGINACVSATGPWGYVTGSACI